MDVWAMLEATGLAQMLKASHWIYPLVNAGHILGIALLIGSVVPMDLRLLGFIRGPAIDQTVRLMRPVSIAGLMLAVLCGTALFVTQATDYAVNPWLRLKLALIAAAVVNAAVHLRLAALPKTRQRVAGAISLALWPAALVCGRMIGFS